MRSGIIVTVIGIIMLAAAPEIQAAEHQLSPGSILEVYFDDIDQPQSRVCLGIDHQANPKLVSRYREDKKQTGVYFRTQFDVLKCEETPCEQSWSAAFVANLELGKSDTIGLQWKQVVFTGITPSGTVKRELKACVNQVCRSLSDPKVGTVRSVRQTATIGPYHFTWSKESLIIGSSDLK